MSITQEISIDNTNTKNFSEMITEVTEKVIEVGRKIVEEWLKQRDEEIKKERDKKRYRNRGKIKTAVKTKLGVIEYRRIRYYDQQEGKYVYLLEEKEEIQNIGLVDKRMSEEIAKMSCVMSYREVAKKVRETTGLSISPQGVWKVVQKMGEKRIEEIKEQTKMMKKHEIIGEVETPILYEEADGDWLKMQGKDRKKYGEAKEMKIGIAYDGVVYQKQKGKNRVKLDNKVAYASFESSKYFKSHKESVIATKFNVDEIELRVKNGDGASWIQKSEDCDCICVLDKYHRNKKITECVKNKSIAENLRYLLMSGKYSMLLEAIEAYINSIEDEKEIKKMQELYSYYSENFDALSDYYDRGIRIPETRNPGVIHHARLGSMESNVFTIIGNRMKGGRACWSIRGGNNLAALLCLYHTSGFGSYNKNFKSVKKEPNLNFSASEIKETSGKGFEYNCRGHVPSFISKKINKVFNCS